MDTFASAAAGSASPPADPLASLAPGHLACSPHQERASPLLLRDRNSAGFDQFSVDLLASVDPTDSIDRLLAEQVILSSERLRRSALLEPDDGLPGADWFEFQAVAERQFLRSLAQWRSHRECKRKAAADRDRLAASIPRGKAKGPGGKPGAGPGLDPPSSPPPPPRPESTPEEIADAFTHWRKYIAIIPKRSRTYPVILRTGREVEDVSAWLNDGKSEEMLMQWYPELSRADIAACNGCDAEGMCGPFDPDLDPYPPTLPILDDFPDDDHSDAPGDGP